MTVVDTLDTAQADLSALADAGRAVPCLRESLLRQYTGRGTPPTVDVSRTAQPPGGTDVVAYRLRIIAGPPGSELPVILDVVSAVRGRAEVSITFRDVNQPVPADQQDRLVRAVLDRLAG